MTANPSTDHARTASNARRALRAPLAVVLALVAAGAPAAPSAASGAGVASGAAAARASKRCPTVGRTLAFEKYGKTVTSRVWRTRGRTYGCTMLRSSRPSTHLLTREKTGLLRLQNDTVAWTTTRVRDGVPTARVSAFDLSYGVRFLSSARAVPRRSAGDAQHEGTVEQLLVRDGFFLAWIANGNTVVVGAADPGDLVLKGPGDLTTPLFLDGALAVAGTYDAGPDVTKQLVDSLTIGDTPGDHGDSDDCAYSYGIAYTWATGPGQPFEANMTGTRTTPDTCE